MNNLLRKIIFITIFAFSFSFAKVYSSENSFCLEKDGFIMPLFEGSCPDQDILLNQEEFLHVSEFDRNERNKKLNEFRKNAKNIENSPKKEITETDKKKVAKDIAEKSIKRKEKQEILFKNNQKRIEEQKRAAKKRKEKLDEQRKLQKEKQLAFQKKLEENQLKRQAKLEKIREQKEKEKALRKAKIKERDELRKKEKRLREAKLRENKEQKKTLNKEKIKKIPPKEVNQNLKVLLVQKNIVKSDLFPSINLSDSQIDFKINSELKTDQLKNLVRFNSNILLIIPKDLELTDNISSENQQMSKVVSGSRQVPNPDFNRLQMEMRRTERELNRALAEAERGFQMSQCYSCGLITQWGGVALQDKYQKIAREKQNKLVSLTSSYSSTPDYLEKKIYSNYNYIVQNVDAEKKAVYDIYKIKNNKFYHQAFNIKDKKKFKVAYNLNPQDENYESLLKKYNTKENIVNWQNSKFKEIKVNNYMAMLNENNEYTEIESIRQIYAEIDSSYTPEKSSFWSNIFSSGNKKDKNKKIASLNKTRNNFIADERFQSVVIVRTENGLGSGFYVNNDEILTNYHVIEKSKNINVIDQNNNKSSAIVLKKDLKRDLALLKTNSKGKPVQFFSGAIKQGSKVDALGHPKGRKFSISQGIVSAIRKEGSVYNATGSDNVLFIQTDAAINKGNSGGPLFLGNKVIGVNTQGLSKQKSEGMNFAVHYSEVLEFLK